MIYIAMHFFSMTVNFKFHYNNISKHNILPDEIIECFYNKHLLFTNPKAKKTDVFKSYKVIGKTDSGKFIEFVFEKQKDSFYVFHANNATAKDINLYK